MSAESHPETAVLIDAHVHCYRSFDLGEFLNHAQHNFTRAAADLGRSFASVGLLALTESREERCFERLSEWGRESPVSGWRIDQTRDPTSLVAKRGEGMALALIAGQQIRLREGFELLAIGGNPGLPDGRPLKETAEGIREAGALPVLPWGFGKWRLRRGRIIDRLLDETRPGGLLLADSGSRPALSPHPKPLAKAKRLGFRIVAGSDPLPFPREIERPGSFGCLIEGSFSLDRPTASLRDLLQTAPAAPRFFGARRPLAGFFRDQLELQLRKRIG